MMFKLYYRLNANFQNLHSTHTDACRLTDTHMCTHTHMHTSVIIILQRSFYTWYSMVQPSEQLRYSYRALGPLEANLYWSGQIVDQVLFVNMDVMWFNQLIFAIMQA